MKVRQNERHSKRNTEIKKGRHKERQKQWKIFKKPTEIKTDVKKERHEERLIEKDTMKEEDP